MCSWRCTASDDKCHWVLTIYTVESSLVCAMPGCRRQLIAAARGPWAALAAPFSTGSSGRTCRATVRFWKPVPNRAQRRLFSELSRPPPPPPPPPRELNYRITCSAPAGRVGPAEWQSSVVTNCTPRVGPPRSVLMVGFGTRPGSDWQQQRCGERSQRVCGRRGVCGSCCGAHRRLLLGRV